MVLLLLKMINFSKSRHRQQGLLNILFSERSTNEAQYDTHGSWQAALTESHRHPCNEISYLILMRNLALFVSQGHVDFAWEVSRSLAACQGALLLVDSSQGVQAQSISVFHIAKERGLKIIPVLSKVRSRLITEYNAN
jgi:hypothetical protein